MASDDLVLIRGVKLAEITAPTPDANHQISVQLRMALGIAEGIDIDGVELELLAAGLDEDAEKKAMRSFV
jgi:hypothetical protein